MVIFYENRFDGLTETEAEVFDGSILQVEIEKLKVLDPLEKSRNCTASYIAAIKTLTKRVAWRRIERDPINKLLKSALENSEENPF